MVSTMTRLRRISRDSLIIPCSAVEEMQRYSTAVLMTNKHALFSVTSIINYIQKLKMINCYISWFSYIYAATIYEQCFTLNINFKLYTLQGSGGGGGGETFASFKSRILPLLSVLSEHPHNILAWLVL